MGVGVDNGAAVSGQALSTTQCHRTRKSLGAIVLGAMTVQVTGICPYLSTQAACALPGSCPYATTVPTAPAGRLDLVNDEGPRTRVSPAAMTVRGQQGTVYTCEMKPRAPCPGSCPYRDEGVDSLGRSPPRSALSSPCQSPARITQQGCAVLNDARQHARTGYRRQRRGRRPWSVGGRDTR